MNVTLLCLVYLVYPYPLITIRTQCVLSSLQISPVFSFCVPAGFKAVKHTWTQHTKTELNFPFCLIVLKRKTCAFWFGKEKLKPTQMDWNYKWLLHGGMTRDHQNEHSAWGKGMNKNILEFNKFEKSQLKQYITFY